MQGTHPKYPITNAQYAAYVAAIGKRSPDHWDNGRVPEGKDKHPVVKVSWDEAKAYCEWLSEQIEQERGKIGLPTEAQWEYAARGSAGREYPWGAEPPDKERCNYDHNIGDTTPVGAYPAGVTPEGVHDLAGNVWEWCGDWYGPYSEDAQQDPPMDGSASAGAVRVVRGGSWGNLAGYCRSAFRIRREPGDRGGDLGFRCARVQEA